jgi:putative peptide zinc metalloprotease protein
MSSRRLLLLLLTLAVVLGLPGHAAAGSDDDGDNAAVAINTKDGSSLFEFAFSLTKVTGDVVDNENAAVAYASCENCRTTAIAIQIVLVVGSPSTVTPKNYAVSVNENCSLCQTFATAFQFVIGVEDASVGLTRQGERELRQILREFKALKREEYTLEEFHAKTQALGARLRTVLKTQLVSKRHRSDDDDDGARLDSERQSEETEQPAPPPAPPAEETTQTTTDPTTTTTTEPATTETQPTTTETTPPETTTTP